MSAYGLLKNIAHRVAAGETITIAQDWGLGSGTLVFPDGSHTHFGADVEDDERKAVDDFINGLNDLLVNGTGLSLCPPPPGWSQTPPTIQDWYWHWGGGEDDAPIPTSVFISGSTEKCFVTCGQLGLTHAIDCAEYGGWWHPMTAPATPKP